MKAFVLCVAIQIVAQTNAKSPRKIMELLGWRKLFEKGKFCYHAKMNKIQRSLSCSIEIL